MVFVIFMVIKLINKLNWKKEELVVVFVLIKEEVLLIEICDLLKE